MKKLTILISAFILACAPGFGQLSAKDAKIEKLLISMNVDKQIDAMFGQMKSMLASQLPASATADQKAKFAEVQGKLLDLVRSRMSWEKMRPQYVKLYSDTFTEEEIDGLVAFYDSPAGKAMLAKMPLVMSKSMAMGQAVVQDLMPQIQQLTKEALTPDPPK